VHWFLQWYWDAYDIEIKSSLQMLMGTCDEAMGDLYEPRPGGGEYNDNQISKSTIFEQWGQIGESLQTLSMQEMPTVTRSPIGIKGVTEEVRKSWTPLMADTFRPMLSMGRKLQMEADDDDEDVTETVHHTILEMDDGIDHEEADSWLVQGAADGVDASPTTSGGQRTSVDTRKQHLLSLAKMSPEMSPKVPWKMVGSVASPRSYVTSAFSTPKTSPAVATTMSSAGKSVSSTKTISATKHDAMSPVSNSSSSTEEANIKKRMFR